MHDTIINPMTGRKVSIYGNLGRSILNNYIQRGGGKPCVYNSNTRRCRYGNDDDKDDLVNCKRKIPGDDNSRCLINEAAKTKKVAKKSAAKPRAAAAKPRAAAAKPRAAAAKPRAAAVAAKKAAPVKKEAVGKKAARASHQLDHTPAKMVKVEKTKSKGSTSRLSAGEYYRSRLQAVSAKERGARDPIGDRCNIRKDGDYKCLIPDRNGVAKWVSKKKKGGDDVRCEDFSSRCQLDEFS